jgi:acyl carrier protein
MKIEKQEIRDFLSEMTNRKIEFNDDDSLLSAGILDSLSIAQLLVFIEERFNIPVDYNQLLPENFETINAIVDFLEGKKI